MYCVQCTIALKRWKIDFYGCIKSFWPIFQLDLCCFFQISHIFRSFESVYHHLFWFQCAGNLARGRMTSFMLTWRTGTFISAPKTISPQLPDWRLPPQEWRGSVSTTCLFSFLMIFLHKTIVWKKLIDFFVCFVAFALSKLFECEEDLPVIARSIIHYLLAINFNLLLASNIQIVSYFEVLHHSYQNNPLRVSSTILQLFRNYFTISSL